MIGISIELEQAVAGQVGGQGHSPAEVLETEGAGAGALVKHEDKTSLVLAVAPKIGECMRAVSTIRTLSNALSHTQLKMLLNTSTRSRPTLRRRPRRCSISGWSNSHASSSYKAWRC